MLKNGTCGVPDHGRVGDLEEDALVHALIVQFAIPSKVLK
jgi:hypothetical protein